MQTFLFHQVDVSDYDAVLEISKVIETELGAVDILVNNAGLLPSVSLREGSPKDIEKIMNVNLMSHFWVSKSFFFYVYAQLNTSNVIFRPSEYL